MALYMSDGKRAFIFQRFETIYTPIYLYTSVYILIRIIKCHAPLKWPRFQHSIKSSQCNLALFFMAVVFSCSMVTAPYATDEVYQINFHISWFLGIKEITGALSPYVHLKVMLCIHTSDSVFLTQLWVWNKTKLHSFIRSLLPLSSSNAIHFAILQHEQCRSFSIIYYHT